MDDKAIYSNRGHVNSYKSDSPVCIPQALFNAVVTTCTYMVMDGNEHNIMNHNNNPLLRQLNTSSGTMVVVCYLPKLLRLWLNFLMQYPLWKRTVMASKVIKRNINGQPVTETETKEIDIFYLPELAEINMAFNQASGSTITLQELIDCRNAIKSCLLPDTGHQAIDLVKYDLARSTVYPRDMLPTVAGIVKPSRLTLLGYQKIKLDPTDQAVFDAFVQAEEARIKATVIRPQHQVLSHEELARLSTEEGEQHNQSVLANMVSLVLEAGGSVGIAQKRQADNVLPVAAINRAFHVTMRSKPASHQQPPPSAAQWKTLCDEYFRICGHVLNTKQEKASDHNKGITAFARRSEQIARARLELSRNLSASAKFIDNDIVVVTHGYQTPAMSTMPTVPTMPTSSSYDSSADTYSQGNYNMSTSNRYSNGPLPTSMYSNNQRTVPASDIQRNMKTVAYHTGNAPLPYNTSNPVHTSNVGSMYSAPGTSNSFANTGGNYASSGANIGVRTHTAGTTSFVGNQPGPNTINTTPPAPVYGKPTMHNQPPMTTTQPQNYMSSTTSTTSFGSNVSSWPSQTMTTGRFGGLGGDDDDTEELEPSGFYVADDEEDSTKPVMKDSKQEIGADPNTNATVATSAQPSNDDKQSDQDNKDGTA